MNTKAQFLKLQHYTTDILILGLIGWLDYEKIGSIFEGLGTSHCPIISIHPTKLVKPTILPK
jgi:hypothetical protein